MTKPSTRKDAPEQRKLRLLFTGLTMGLADLVPGVSGGTIAFLFGIYEELLFSIKLMTGRIPKLIIKGKFKEAFKLIPFGFLIPLFSGIALSIFGLVHIVSFLLETQPIAVWALFFGLVLGSSYIVSRRIKKWNYHKILLLVSGLAITYIIVGLPSMSGDSSPVAIFLTGAIAITAMILPGISGSLIMVLLGQYETVINAVASRNILLLVIFATGALVGLALFVRLLTWLLKKYHFEVMAVLIGIMLGSLRRIWPWQNSNADSTVTNILPVIEFALLWPILLIITGFMIVFILERVGITKEHNDIKNHN